MAYEHIYNNMFALQFAKDIKMINVNFYMYRVRQGGGNLSSNEVFIKKLPQYIEMVKAVLKMDYSNKYTQSHMI